MKTLIKIGLTVGLLVVLFGCSPEYQEAATTASAEPPRVNAPEPEKIRPEPEPQLPDEYGDDPFFDDLWDRCEAGEFDACEDLYYESPFGSAYETYGSDRIAELNDEVTERDVVDLLGPEFLLDMVWDGMTPSDRDEMCLGLRLLGPIESGKIVAEGSGGLVTAEEVAEWLTAKCA